MPVETKTPDQENPYYSLEQDGSVLPLDPITGTVLQPGVVPESLLADEELQAGYNFLVSNAPRINFTLLLSRHHLGEDLQNAGINLRSEAQAIAVSNGVLFLECISSNDKTHEAFAQQLNRISHLPADKADETLDELIDVAKSEGPKSAWTAKAALLANTGVRIALPDYVASSDRTADQTLEQWSSAKRDQDTSQIKGVAAWQALDVGYVTYRDWYLICKMGRDLQTLDMQGQLDENIAAALVAGPMHGTIGTHMNNMGVHVVHKGDDSEKLHARSPRLARDLGNIGVAKLTMAKRIEFLAEKLVDDETL